jgi:cyclophilin family peptidyl-prolyl cis-trans isomerase
MSVYAYGLLAHTNVVSGAVCAKALGDPEAVVRLAGVDCTWREQAAKVTFAAPLREPLLALVAHDPDAIVRARAAVALVGWSDAPDAAAIGATIFADFSAEHDPTVRWHLAWTLRRGYAKSLTLAQVQSGLQDSSETVRIEFADIAARRGNIDAIPSLRALSGDASWRVREQALESLLVLGGGKRTDHLTAIPAGVVTPPPVAMNREVPLPRPTGLGLPHAPTAADATILPTALMPTTSAMMDGPLPGPHPRVRIRTTQGDIVVRLYPEWAPLTVANFLGLVDRGWYDGLRWFRVVPDFVAQTGDHTNTGDGDAGYTITAEENPLEQRYGVISMGLNYTEGANPGPIRDSAGTQFYITMSPQLHLDRDFTVFGEIEHGYAVLGRLTEKDTMTRVEELPPR